MALATLTKPQMRAIAYQHINGLGIQSTADSIAVDGITDTAVFQNSARGAAKYRGRLLWRYNLSGDDRVKGAGLISSGGKILHTSNNYVDTTDTAYELVGMLHPDQIEKAADEANRLVYFRTHTPLTAWQDGDFSGSDITVWTANQVNAGAAYSSTAINNDAAGWQSLVVTNTSANGYTQTPFATCSPGELLYAGALAHVNAAGQTGYFRVWDVSHNVELGTGIQFSDLQTQHLKIVVTIPDGCYKVACRLQGVGTNDAIVWDALPSHFLGRRRPSAADYIDAEFKLLSLQQAEYGPELATGRAVAASRDYLDWDNPVDWDIDIAATDARNSIVLLHRSKERGGIPQADLWQYALRPYFDREPLTGSQTATTTAPYALIIAAFEYLLAKEIAGVYPTEPQWPAMMADRDVILQAQKVVRKGIKARRERRSYSPGARMGSRSW